MNLLEHKVNLFVISNILLGVSPRFYHPPFFFSHEKHLIFWVVNEDNNMRIAIKPDKDIYVHNYNNILITFTVITIKKIYIYYTVLTYTMLYYDIPSLLNAPSKYCSSNLIYNTKCTKQIQRI